MGGVLRWIKWFLGIALVLGGVVFALLQMPSIQRVIQERVISSLQKEGISLEISTIQGRVPLTWDIPRLTIATEDVSVSFEEISAQFSLLPLFGREISLASLKAKKGKISFSQVPHSLTLRKKGPFSLSIHSFSIDSLELENRETKKIETLLLKGSLHLNRRGSLQAGSLFLKNEQLQAELVLESFQKEIFGKVRIPKISSQALELFQELPITGSFQVNGEFSIPKKAPFHLRGQLHLHFEEVFAKLDSFSSISPLTGTLTSTVSWDGSKVQLTKLICKSDQLKCEGTIALGKSPSCELSYLLENVSIPYKTISIVNGGTINGHCSFSEKQISLIASSSDLSLLKSKTATTSTAVISLEKENNSWRGTGALSLQQKEISITADSSLSLTDDLKTLSVHSLSLTLPEGFLAGECEIPLFSLENTQGSFLLQINNLSLWKEWSGAETLSGRLGASCELSSEKKQLTLGCHSLIIDSFATKSMEALFDLKEGVGFCNFGETYWEEALFSLIHVKLDQKLGSSYLSGNIEGEWKTSFSLAFETLLKKETDKTSLAWVNLQGSFLGTSLSLESPCFVSYKDEAFSLSELRLNIGDGFLGADFSLQEKGPYVFFRADQIPLEPLSYFSPRCSFSGSLSLDIRMPIKGEGFYHAALQKGVFTPSGEKEGVLCSGELSGNVLKSSITTLLKASMGKNDSLALEATVPLKLSLVPPSITLLEERSCEGTLSADLAVDKLLDLVNMGSQRIEGRVVAELTLSQTLKNPNLEGSLSLKNGLYENYISGIFLTPINIDAIGVGSTLQITSFSAEGNREGSAKGIGSVSLEKNLPFSLEATITSLPILQLGWLQAFCSGPVRLVGTTEQILTQGSVEIVKAKVQVPDQIPAEAPSLPFTFVEPIKNQKEIVLVKDEKNIPFHYDAILKAPGTIQLEGRGLSCTLGGVLEISGKNLSLEAKGNLELVKGKFSFAGKEFSLTHGEISFTDGKTLPFLHLIGTTHLAELSITADLKGPLSGPRLTFTSSPPLPSSTILSYILFNKDVSELSAAQALQLADTIVSLSGSAAPGILDTIRKALGVDRLTVSSTEEGPISVQIGKYLMQGVLITLSQSTESSLVMVEVELKNGFVLQGETQEDDQAKFSLKWNKNY